MQYFVYRGKIIKKVGFLGLGKSNIAIMEYISRHYPNVKFTVRCKNEIRLPDFNITHSYFGENALSNISEDVLFLSPSARRDVCEIEDAQNRGVIISSDAELFFDSTSADVFAVTGSDGKSTTTYLSSMLLSQRYNKCIPAGNIGVALSSQIDNPATYAYVAELSSFQLMYMKPGTKRCVITNISENHLNWHTSYSEYINAKRNIFEKSNQRIINYDCEVTRSLASDYPIFAVFSNKYSESEIRKNLFADVYITRDGFYIRSSESHLLDVRDMKISGEHNILNFMAAISLSYGLCDESHITQVAKSFCGLSHRCERIGCFHGVNYYDSSIDSSPKRCKATLEMMNERVILILGGRSKGLDFSELAPTLARKAKHIILTGECADEIEQTLLSSREFQKSGISYIKKSSFEDAVKCAISTSKHGDTVLLSPAATSYDSFSGFEERGNAFKRIVKDICGY